MPEFLELKSRADLQRLVDEGLEESLTLDYKASPALKRESHEISELCKDVSAFANSAGGQIVYGVEEEKKTHKPTRIDEGITDAKLTREWIEQTLNSRIHPRLHGVRIDRIDVGKGGYAFVISIPQTNTGPHQAPDKKYYRRFELQSVAMEDYEIRDIMQRSTTPELFMNLGFPSEPFPVTWGADASQSTDIELLMEIGNRSHQPALYTHINLYLDQELHLVKSGSHSSNTHVLANGQNVHKLTFQLVTPHSFPIFREKLFKLGSGTLFAIPLKYQSGSQQFHISYEIHTPGFAFQREGKFLKFNKSLRITWDQK